MSAPTDEAALDGNAIGGLLEEVFGADVTAALVTCSGCRATAAVAEQKAYVGAGAVLRCRGCDHLLARVVRTPDQLWVELSGSASWRFQVSGS